MSEFVRIIDPSGKTIRNDLYNSPPDAASYIIFKDGGLIKAKNCRTGQIEFSGTDAATVIQEALNALPEGGKLFVKNGVYTTLNPPKGIDAKGKWVVIEGENMFQTILKGINISIDRGVVRNLKIDMSGTTYTCLDACDVYNKLIEKVYFYNWGHAGLRLPNYSAINGLTRYSSSRVTVRDCLFRNDRAEGDTVSGGILLEGKTGGLYVVGCRFERHNIPFIEAYGEGADTNIDDVWLIGNEFVGPQVAGDPMYPMCGKSAGGGALHVIGNVWKFAEEEGLDSYKNPGIQLMGKFVEFVGNIMIGGRVETPGSFEKYTYMQVFVKDAGAVHIEGNLFCGGTNGEFLNTSFRTPKDIDCLVIKDNLFYRNGYRCIVIGNPGYSVILNIGEVVIENNVFVDWNWSNAYQYIAVNFFGGASDDYPLNITKLLLRNNSFVKLTEGGELATKALRFTVRVNIDTFICEGNDFKGIPYIFTLKESNINTEIIRRNIGYVTENSGTATFSGDGTTDDFSIGAHGLAITDPNKIVVKVTPISSDAIAASPCTGYVDPADNTKIRVKFASAPASGTDNVTIIWEAQVAS